MEKLINLEQYRKMNKSIEEIIEEPINHNEMILDIVEDFMRFALMRNIKKGKG